MYIKYLLNFVVFRLRIIIELEEDGVGEIIVCFLLVVGKGIFCIFFLSWVFFLFIKIFDLYVVFFFKFF